MWSTPAFIEHLTVGPETGVSMEITPAAIVNEQPRVNILRTVPKVSDTGVTSTFRMSITFLSSCLSWSRPYGHLPRLGVNDGT